MDIVDPIGEDGRYSLCDAMGKDCCDDKRKCLLGEGTFGSVCRAIEIVTGAWVAVKISKDLSKGEERECATKLNVDELQNTSIPNELYPYVCAWREIQALKKLIHPNVVVLLDSFESNGKVCAVLELLEGDLKKFMKQIGRSLDPCTIQSFAKQLCQGMAYCHAQNVVHRDIKPQKRL